MSDILLAPDDFAHVWGADSLVRLPKKHEAIPIPSDARHFLLRAGLPALITYREYVPESKITFCRLAMGLSPLLSEWIHGPQWPSSWSVYWVLGEEFFCNGSANWCIHQDSGHIVRIDVELNEPVEFANTSVRHFTSAILTAVSWSESCKRSAADWPREVDRLRSQLLALDPESVGPRRTFWQVCLEMLREEGLEKGGFEKGSMSAGLRAQQAGPW